MENPPAYAAPVSARSAPHLPQEENGSPKPESFRYFTKNAASREEGPRDFSSRSNAASRSENASLECGPGTSNTETSSSITQPAPNFFKSSLIPSRASSRSAASTLASAPDSFMNAPSVTLAKGSRLPWKRLLLFLAPLAIPLIIPASGEKNVTIRSDSPKGSEWITIAFVLTDPHHMRPESRKLKYPSLPIIRWSCTSMSMLFAAATSSVVISLSA